MHPSSMLVHACSGLVQNEPLAEQGQQLHKQQLLKFSNLYALGMPVHTKQGESNILAKFVS